MLRPASDRDADDIRRWRNHPDVRAVEPDHHEIDPAEHAAWFAAAASATERRVLIYEHDGHRRGVVTFVRHRRAARTATGASTSISTASTSGARRCRPGWSGREAVDYAFGALGWPSSAARCSRTTRSCAG